MNPGISIRFGTLETHKRPPHLGSNAEHFYLLPEDFEQSGDVSASATTIAIKGQLCRLPDQVLASKHRDSAEFSFLSTTDKIIRASVVFHPEQIWAGGGPQGCGPFAIRYPAAAFKAPSCDFSWLARLHRKPTNHCHAMRRGHRWSASHWRYRRAKKTIRRLGKSSIFKIRGLIRAAPCLTPHHCVFRALRKLIAGSAVSALGTLLFGLFATGLWSGAFFNAIAGIGFAGAYMPGLKALTDRLAPGDSSRAVTLYTSSFFR
jgi:hypothetical protein